MRSARTGPPLKIRCNTCNAERLDPAPRFLTFSARYTSRGKKSGADIGVYIINSCNYFRCMGPCNTTKVHVPVDKSIATVRYEPLYNAIQRLPHIVAEIDQKFPLTSKETFIDGKDDEEEEDNEDEAVDEGDLYAEDECPAKLGEDVFSMDVSEAARDHIPTTSMSSDPLSEPPSEPHEMTPSGKAFMKRWDALEKAAGQKRKRQCQARDEDNEDDESGDKENRPRLMQLNLHGQEAEMADSVLQKKTVPIPDTRHTQMTFDGTPAKEATKKKRNARSKYTKKTLQTTMYRFL